MYILGIIIGTFAVIGLYVDCRYKFMPVSWCAKMYKEDPVNYKPVYKRGKYFGLKHGHTIYLSATDQETRDIYFKPINKN